MFCTPHGVFIFEECGAIKKNGKRTMVREEKKNRKGCKKIQQRKQTEGVEGDEGTLSFQGTRFLGFERNR